MKYVVVNEYGITLKVERKDNSGYAYIPRSDGEQSYQSCEKWIRKNDSANTCGIDTIN